MGTTVYYRKIADKELPGLSQMLESHIPFEKWGFKQSFYGAAKEFVPSIIYNSDKCRVRFGGIPADMRDGPNSGTLEILYGRLHASNHKRTRMWKTRQCHCWHELYLDRIYQFLDGLSPQEAVNKNYELPFFISQFKQLNKASGWSNVEWSVRLTSLIWEHYGNRLFELFDLYRPDLWEQYIQFLTEFYKLKPYPYNPSAPPRENRC